MNLYDKHSDPKQLSGHKDRYNHVPALVYQQFEEGETLSTTQIKTISKSAEYATGYARRLDKRFPLGEYAISKSPQYGFEYARYVIKGRWKPAEKAIATVPKYALVYADIVLHGRFEEAEHNILHKEDGYYAYDYARDVLKRRWKEAEFIFARDPSNALWYAEDVVKGKFEAGEEAIASSSGHKTRYNKFLLKKGYTENELI